MVEFYRLMLSRVVMHSSNLITNEMPRMLSIAFMAKILTDVALLSSVRTAIAALGNGVFPGVLIIVLLLKMFPLASHGRI